MDFGNDPASDKESAKSFVNYCADKFGWSDLSKDTVMDVGCGVDGFCGTAILDKFPEVGSIVGIDNNRDTVKEFIPKNSTKMSCDFADIQIRQDLGRFEGRFTKVVSRRVFDEFDYEDQKEAFRNLFHILRPGGEAAVSFILKSVVEKWSQEMLQISKWKEAFQDPNTSDNSCRKTATDYQEMVEEIGFQVIDCEERENIFSLTRQQCADILYSRNRNYFNISSDALDEEFKKDSFEVLSRITLAHTDLHLLFKKPA